MADDDRAEPRADAEAVLDAGDDAVLTTAARALTVGNALATPAALLGLEDDLQRIGFTEVPNGWGSWEKRLEIIDASDAVLREFGAADVLTRELELAPDPPSGPPRREQRVALWRRIASDSTAVAEAVAWLRLVMADDEPIAAAAAAAALTGWRKRKGVEIPVPLAAAQAKVDRATASDIETASLLARAAGGDYTDAVRDFMRGPADVSGPTTSLMVHGTFGWPGEWWRVGGDFHTYVLENIRSDLYARPNSFDWSGAYRARHRKVGARRLAEWVIDATGGDLNTLFAHSYGGVIALMATSLGVRVQDLVLLSVPVEHPAVEWRNVQRAVSLRIHMDLVLLAARRRQRFTENVEEHWIDKWFVNHADSHDPTRWQDEGWAAHLKL